MSLSLWKTTSITSALAGEVMRSGMYVTCINRYLTPGEAAYIVEDSTSQVIFASAELAQTRDLAALIPNCKHRYILGDATSAFAGFYEDFEQAISAQPKNPFKMSVLAMPTSQLRHHRKAQGHQAAPIRCPCQRRVAGGGDK